MIELRSSLLVALAAAALHVGACSSDSSSGPLHGDTGGSSGASSGGSGGSSGSSGADGGSGGSSGGSGGSTGGSGASSMGSGGSSVGGSNGRSGGSGSGGTSVGSGGASVGSGGTSVGSGGTSVGSGGTSVGSGGTGIGAAGAGGRSGAGGTGGGSSVGAGGASVGTGGSVAGSGGGAGGAGGRSGAGGTVGGAGGSSGGSSGSSSTCVAGSTKIGNTCQSGWSAIMGKYILNNNWWGTSGATGEQCVWGTCQDGDVVGWVTNWNWSGGTSPVLTYTSIVFGWQYGFQVSNTGLPIQVSTNKAINCGWDFTLTQTSGAYNVAYDIWLHTSANPPSNGGQSDEIMIWLSKAGNPLPAGSTFASGISIAGATWNLSEGNVGWPVHSYLRTSNTSSATMNVMAFMNDLVTRGLIPNTRYVTGVQAGVEVRSGGGTLTTNGFYCRIE
jgi:xyloglucan-specific endo-beta-1,4-glucanase